MQFLRAGGAWGAGPPAGLGGLGSAPPPKTPASSIGHHGGSNAHENARSWSHAVSARSVGRPQTVVSYASLAGPARLDHARPLMGPTKLLSPRQQRGLSKVAVCAASPDVDPIITLEKGVVVEFTKEGRAVALGRLQRPDGKKNWVVLDKAGLQHSVRPQQLAYVLPGRNEEANLSELEADARALADPSLLELAWGLMAEREDKASVTAAELCEVLFGGRTGGVPNYAAHLLLSNDRVFFKRKGRGGATYEARAEDQVQKMKTQVAAEEAALARAEEEMAAHKLEVAGFVEEVRAAAALSPGGRPSPEAWREGAHAERVAALEAFALEEADRDEVDTAEECLHVLNRRKTGGAAAEILGEMGVWLPHESVHVRRAGLAAAFPEDIEAAAAALLANPPADPDADHRMDLTHLKVYTIDDESTTEIDDGLSVELLPDGRQRVWVHVADPSRYIIPNGELDLEARSRATSVYLPTGVVPMFPWGLAAGPFSLRQGEESCAMSVGIVLADDGSIDEYAIVPSKIKVTYRLTYEETDELCMMAADGQEPELAALQRMGDRRHAWRQAQGSIEIQMPEVDVRVRDRDPAAAAEAVAAGARGAAAEPEVTVEGVDMQHGSRIMVAELMILSGEVAAAVGAELGIALPYRGQPEPTLPPAEEMLALPPGPCRAVALRRCMTRSMQAVNAPIRHAALGLDGYCQFSSPIRRYTDMLAHWQMKAALRGEDPPFSNEELGVLVAKASETQREMSQVERGSTKFWYTYYLAQRVGEPQNAMLLRWLREDIGLASILVTNLGLELTAKLTGNYKPGDVFFVKVASADPREDVLRVVEYDPDAIPR